MEGDQLVVECSTTTPDVTYTIEHKSYCGSFENWGREECGEWKTVYQGHRYTVDDVTHAGHSGWYRCNAANSVADRDSFQKEVLIPSKYNFAKSLRFKI